jgi:FkbM family methyltransferase
MSYYSQEFSLAQRLTSRISRALNFAYTSRRGLTRGLKRRGGLGWLPGGRPTAEEEFLRSLDLAGKTVWDVGAFVGVMTLFFASRARQVVTYEPLPQSREKILANLRLNGFTNVILREVALGRAPGELNLVFEPTMAGGATADPEIAAELSASAPHPHTICATVATGDEELFASGMPRPDLIKLDVEGMEHDVLLGMRQLLKELRPQLYCELHGTTPADKQCNAAQVIGLMREYSYRIYDVEAGRFIPPDATITGRESHVHAAT